jgi:hypothetical protein
MHRRESRLTGIEKQKQAETVTVVVVEDENFYGNAHLLRRKAGSRKDEGGKMPDEPLVPEPPPDRGVGR